MGETIADGTAGVQVVNKSAEEFYGFYDNSYDYSAEEQYSVAYIVQTSGVLYEAFSHAFSLPEGTTATIRFTTVPAAWTGFWPRCSHLLPKGLQGFCLTRIHSFIQG